MTRSVEDAKSGWSFRYYVGSTTNVAGGDVRLNQHAAQISSNEEITHPQDARGLEEFYEVARQPDCVTSCKTIGVYQNSWVGQTGIDDSHLVATLHGSVGTDLHSAELGDDSRHQRIDTLFASAATRGCLQRRLALEATCPGTFMRVFCRAFARIHHATLRIIAGCIGNGTVPDMPKKGYSSEQRRIHIHV